MVLCASLLAMVLVQFAAALSLEAAPPQFGDIYLSPCSDERCYPAADQVTGTLMVYFNQDNAMNDQLVYKPVCSDQYKRTIIKKNFIDVGSTAICKMLGYEEGKLFLLNSAPELKYAFPKYLDGSYALSQVDCTSGDPAHLLRCRYKEESLCNEGPLHLTCSKRSITKQNLLPYTAIEGSVQLCPPDQTINSTQYPHIQISTGLVSVWHDGYYGTINEQPNTVRFGTHEGDSICRQLGFTKAESIRTVESYRGEFTFNNCFHKTGFSGDSKVWLTTETAAQCSHNSCPCFSNCYESLTNCPLSPASSSGCPQGYCCQGNNIVIECTFDITEPQNIPIAGTNHQLCNTAVCSQEPPGYTLPQVVAPVLSLALVVLIAAFVVGLVTWFYRRRGGYVPVPGDNQPNNNQPQNGDAH